MKVDQLPLDISHTWWLAQLGEWGSETLGYQSCWHHTNKNVFVLTRHLDNVWRERSHAFFFFFSAFTAHLVLSIWDRPPQVFALHCPSQCDTPSRGCSLMSLMPQLKVEQLFLSIFHTLWQVHLGRVETVDLGFEREVACVFHFFTAFIAHPGLILSDSPPPSICSAIPQPVQCTESEFFSHFLNASTEGGTTPT